MTSLVLLTLMVLAGYGVGCLALRALGIRPETPVAGLVWNLAIGLGLVGLALAAAGMVGWLYRGAIVTLTGLSAAAGLWMLVRESWTGVPRVPGREAEAARGRGVAGLQTVDDTGARIDRSPARLLHPSRLRIALGAAAVACAGAALIGALAPPTAGDAMCYHLELPKQFLAEHTLSYVPDSDNSTYPLLMEMLYLWGLALGGGVLAQLMHWLAGVLLAGATIVLAQPVVGRRAARLGGALVLLVPGVTNQMTAPLNDLGLALYTTLAAAAVLHAARTGLAKWYILAGLCLGFAAGVKFLGGMFAAALGVALARRVLRARARGRQGDKGIRGQGDKETRSSDAPAVSSPGLLVPLSRPGANGVRVRAAGVVLCCAFAALAGGAWYVRSYAYTGNPVYPFFGEWLGSGRTDALPARKRPLTVALGDVLRAPWAITMHPEQFGGRSHQLGAVFLAVLPGWFLLRRNRRLGPLLAIAGIYVAIWYALRQNVRFLLPVVPLLSVVAVRVLLEARRFQAAPRWVLVGCVGLLALFSVAIAARRVRDRVAVVVGAETAEQFLARQEPTFEVARWVNAHLRDDAVILSQDFRAFYFQRKLVRENLYRRRTEYDRRLTETGNVPAALRARGFTHVLLAQGAEAGTYDTTLTPLLEQRAGALVPVFEHAFRSADGRSIRYRLVEL